MFYKEYDNSFAARARRTIVANGHQYESAPHIPMQKPNNWVLLGAAGSSFEFAQGVLKFVGCTSNGPTLEIPIKNVLNETKVNTCTQDAKKKVSFVVPATLDCNAKYMGVQIIWRQSDSDSRTGLFEYFEPIKEQCEDDTYSAAAYATRLAARFNTKTDGWQPVVATVTGGTTLVLESYDGKEFFIDGSENLNNYTEIVKHSSENFKGRDLGTWGVNCNPFAETACLRVLTFHYEDKVWADGHFSSSSDSQPHGHYILVKKSISVVSNDTGAAKTQYDALAQALRGEATPASKYHAVANVVASPTPVPTPV